MTAAFVTVNSSYGRKKQLQMTAVLHSYLRQLDVSVDVEAVVFACQNDGTVIHEGHVETLGMLHFALEGRQQLKRKNAF